LEVLEALKRNSVTKHIPVIVLTSLSQKNEAKLLQAGAAAYLTKSDKLLESDSILLSLVNTLGPKAKSATPGG
jgi:CheY-like chemotaxis protein